MDAPASFPPFHLSQNSNDAFGPTCIKTKTKTKQMRQHFGLHSIQQLLGPTAIVGSEIDIFA